MGRFLVNSTVGVAGLFDPASRMKIPEREEDFGQTLATWGWRRSRYLELPFFGPSTVRDAFGIAADSPLQPVSYVEADKVRIGLTALNLVDMRTRLMAFDSLRDEASDDYLLVRDTWSQRRNFQIKGGTGGDASLPDYLKE
ncbi:ABC-type transporter lipoprotein component MlaA [Pseudoxanthomonas sacheonensis]|uniref:ABC-type transporter lipoprotein component MlaA n=1 Tax=Pseudoxanthomonas sacheonensis TaxID=443615 RepID=A0ABU1RQS1_9GAMM|nr:ABC-type transporter lipoprotein component MlaA [Pseudoxanthomonas sacheonensis]